MDLNDFRYFALVVEHGGFSAAERYAYITKSKLSRRIANLEERLGVRLLQRNTRHLTLTEAGQLFYDRCVAVMVEAQGVEQTMAELRSEPAGKVRITCPISMAQCYVARVVADYVRLHPKVNVEIEATDRQVDLVEERFDIGLGAAGEHDDASLVQRRIASSRFIVVATPTYLAHYPAIEDPEQLKLMDTIGPSHEGARQTWSLTHADGRIMQVVVRPRMLCSDVMMQYQAVLGGAGVALLPMAVAWPGLRDGYFEHIAKGWDRHDVAIQLLYHSRRGMLPSVRTLIDHLAQHIPEYAGSTLL